MTPSGAVFSSIAEAVLAHDSSCRWGSLSCPSWAKMGSVCALYVDEATMRSAFFCMISSFLIVVGWADPHMEMQ